ncbi:MAG TPA: bifunctional homocysteine S-methyltransferase/methylenetetrahydrofolate reductase [Thermomicrobiales bacterium]|nr:bifunctional homocysteine S-methyltransferase/methylenetetrahydrofolate reductase [Thermomicrobiales bacterium]
MTHPLIDRLSARTLLADGAMGTLIHEAGVPMGTCFDHLNLSNPDLIGSIHRAYVSAGADIIETNTYGANQLKLAEFGLEDKVRDINLRAVKIAREAREVVGREVFVVGSIGPTRSAMDPLMPDEIKLLEPIYAQQIEALLEGGVDAICIETISDIREMAVAVNAVRKTSDLPIIASLAFGEDGTTPGGNPVNEVVASLLALDVDVVGANCSVGPNQMLPIIQMMTSLVSGTYNRQIPVSTMPNAGWPARVDGRYVFSSSPDYLGKFAAEAAVAGARLIGGCCGTTPDHTHAMRRTLDEQEGHSTLVIHEVRLPSTYEYEENGDESPTELKRKLGKDFVICVEIDPPKGLNPTKALDGARLLKDAGVTAINVADSPMARVRMSALMMSHLIQAEVGVEAIVHFTTRDRSLMAIQSELLGAHAAGVRNILALTGDPPSLGDYPDSSAVYDIDSIGLIKVLSKMNEGVDWSGAPLGRNASFTIACAVDPTREDLALEASRLREKLAAGAHFVMTQPIYDVEVWLRFLEHFGGQIPVPVMIGILPLQSARHAEFLHNEVPGITLTKQALERMRSAGNHGRQVGVEMARELLLDLKPHSQGVYLMPSFGRYEVAAEVLAGVVTPA